MRKRLLTSLILLLSALITVNQADAQGRVLYSDGDVELHKGGELLDGKDIRQGTELQEFDLIRTGSDGFTEIEITSQGSGSILIKAENNTSFYYSALKKPESTETVINMLSGSIGIKLKKMTSGDKLNVFSRNAVLGAKGTEFNIAASPDGSILVTCPEGIVSCSLSSGEEVIAGSGMIVEVLQGRQIKGVDVGIENLEMYRAEWFTERVKVFRAGAFSLTKPVIIQYEELADRFNIYYKELKEFEKLFRKYSIESDDIDEGEIIEDKIMVSQAVLNMKSVFFTFDEFFYRIDEIKRFHDLIPVKGTLRKKYDIDDFMKDFQKNYKGMAKKAAYTRQVFRIYEQMENDNAFKQ